MARKLKEFEIRGSDRWGYSVWAYAYSVGLEDLGVMVRLPGHYFKRETAELAKAEAEREAQSKVQS